MRPRVIIFEKPTEPNVDTITIPVNVSLAGKYEIELIDAKTKNTLEHHKFSNLLTNDGLNTFGALQTGETYAFEYFQFGEGSTTASITDTNLVSPVAGRTNTSDISDAYTTGSDATGSYWEATLTRFFLESEANGNLTEVGAFTKSSGGRLTTRALIRDITNTPITITKTSSNQLRLRYTLRMYLPTNDVTGSVDMLGSTYNYTIRAHNVFVGNAWGYQAVASSNNGGFMNALVRGGWTNNTITGVASPSGSLVSYSGSISLGGTTSNCSAVSSLTYVDNTFYRDVEYTFNGSVANFGTTGIRALTLQPLQTAVFNLPNSSQYQVVFSPPIPKTNLRTLKLRFRFGWNRAATSE